MSISFSGSELINVAINIERRGIAFYDVMAKSSDNEAARHIFQHLAGMEREHIRVFQDMIPEAGAFPIPELFSEEYAGYLQALVDSAVFTDDTVTSETAIQVDSDIKALELGISAEKDSILFYYQMKDVMPERTHPTMDKIIIEEKSHLTQLSGLKKELEKQ